jgi:hypothetical protein
MVTQTHTPSSWAQGSDHISQPGLGLAKGWEQKWQVALRPGFCRWHLPFRSEPH